MLNRVLSLPEFSQVQAKQAYDILAKLVFIREVTV